MYMILLHIFECIFLKKINKKHTEPVQFKKHLAKDSDITVTDNIDQELHNGYLQDLYLHVS